VSRPAAAALILALLLPPLLPPPAAAAPDFAAMNIQRYEPPKPAPEFSLPDLAGRRVTLSELRGKVVLLFYWATW
jgi:cytochrome oxidase Cu insertion factor (SCO1/SenC/PrrC family)